jgi:hypothetical protein
MGLRLVTHEPPIGYKAIHRSMAVATDQETARPEASVARLSMDGVV